MAKAKTKEYTSTDWEDEVAPEPEEQQTPPQGEPQPDWASEETGREAEIEKRRKRLEELRKASEEKRGYISEDTDKAEAAREAERINLEHQRKISELRAEEKEKVEGEDREAARSKRRYEDTKGKIKDVTGALKGVRNLLSPKMEERKKVKQTYFGVYPGSDTNLSKPQPGEDIRKLGKPPTQLVKQTQSLSSSHMRELIPASENLRGVNRPPKAVEVTPTPKMRQPYSAYNNKPENASRVYTGLKQLKSTQQPQLGMLQRSTMITSMGQSRIAKMAMPGTGRPQGFSMREDALRGGVSPIQALARGTFGLSMSQETEQQPMPKSGLNMPKPTLNRLKVPVRATEPEKVESKLPSAATLGLKQVKKFNPSYYNKAVRKFKKEVR